MLKKFSLMFLLAHTALHSMVPGTLDTTFNPSGAQPGTTVTLLGYDDAYDGILTVGSTPSIALQSDGKIVAGGTANDGTNSLFALARFNTDGTLDTSFNSTGTQPGTVVVPLINGSDSFGNSIVIQSDGKILLGGWSSNGATNVFTIVRFNTDGSLDTSFGTAGIAQAPATAANGGQAYALAVQTDGKIVLAGESYDPTDTRPVFTVVRFNTDGSLDTSFNASGPQPGIAQTPIVNGSSSAAFGVAIQSDGKIIPVGYVPNPATPGQGQLALARFNADGTLDDSFNPTGLGSSIPGIVTTFIPNTTESQNNGVVIQSDGKIVTAGLIYDEPTATYFSFVVARYNSDGSLDSSFNATGDTTGVPGTLAIPINGLTFPLSLSFAQGLVLQNNGQIVVSGSSFPNLSFHPVTFDYSGDNFALARLNTNGTLDTTFNPAGQQPGTVITTINNNPGGGNGYQVALQKNGQLLIVGNVGVTGVDYLGLARFNGRNTTNTFALELINKYSSVL